MDNTSKYIWADRACRSEDHKLALSALECRSHVHKKGKRSTPLSERDKNLIK